MSFQTDNLLRQAATDNRQDELSLQKRVNTKPFLIIILPIIDLRFGFKEGSWLSFPLTVMAAQENVHSGQ